LRSELLTAGGPERKLGKRNRHDQHAEETAGKGPG